MTETDRDSKQFQRWSDPSHDIVPKRLGWDNVNDGGLIVAATSQEVSLNQRRQDGGSFS